MNWTKGWAAPSRSEPVLELLEDRCLFAAQLDVIVGGCSLIGEAARITITYSNHPDGSTGGNVCYLPYNDLVLPTKRADGSASDANPVRGRDGVTFQDAILNGRSVQATQLEFNASGTGIHPFADDRNGNLWVACASDNGARPGDRLVVLSPPFGSRVADPARAPVQLMPGVAELVDQDVPLPFSAVGGFGFGCDVFSDALSASIAASSRAARGRRSSSGPATRGRQAAPSCGIQTQMSSVSNASEAIDLSIVQGLE